MGDEASGIIRFKYSWKMSEEDFVQECDRLGLDNDVWAMNRNMVVTDNEEFDNKGLPIRNIICPAQV